MPQNDQTNNNSSEANKQDDSTSHATIRAKFSGLRLIIVAGCILVLALLFLSIYLPYLTERVKFFTVNLLSLLVLAAIAVQAYIYRKQWEVMQGQLGVMRETIAENRRNFYVIERAYVSISHIQFTDNPETEQMRTIQIEIINGGRTPAWDVRMRVRVSVEDPTSDKSRPYVKTADHVETRSIPRVLLPSKTEPVIIKPDITVSESMSLEVMDLSGIFVRGEIYFTDISEKEQALPFCFVWKPKTPFFENCKRGEKQSNSENPN
jgi:hypothetical protein